MAGIVFAEFFPIMFDSPEEAVRNLESTVLSLRKDLPPRVSVETSVHAPYTVDPESSGLAARRARERGGRLAIHLSESPEEYEFVLRGTGGLERVFGGLAGWGGGGGSPGRGAGRVGVFRPGAH